MELNQKVQTFPKLIFFVLILIVNVSQGISQNVIKNENQQTVNQRVSLVQNFVKAFNDHQPKRMMEMADENIQWISISGANVQIEVEGASLLQKSMEKYFSSCPTCQSALEWIESSEERVITIERAEWKGKNGLNSQKSVAIYEFRNDKIFRVFYFPSEKVSVKIAQTKDK